MQYKASLFVIFVLLLSCNPRNSSTDFEVVFKSNKEGETLSGSKKALLQHIRGGSDIKIGWGSKGKNHTIEHLSTPIWISLLDESEVIVHLDPQVLSKIDWENLSANYAESKLLQQEWRVVITTKGEFDAVWYDRKEDTIIRHYPQRHVMTWYAKGKIADLPLFEDNRE